jgi:hypothetical protein
MRWRIGELEVLGEKRQALPERPPNSSRSVNESFSCWQLSYPATSAIASASRSPGAMGAVA